MTMHEAQDKLPELGERARAGEDIFFTSADQTTAVRLEISSLPAALSLPRLGFLSHLGMTLPNDWDDALGEEELRLREARERDAPAGYERAPVGLITPHLLSL